MGRLKGGRNTAPHPQRRTVRRSLADYPTPTPQSTPCRLWQGSLSGEGYGRKWNRDEQKFDLVHRWIMEQIHGALPRSVYVLHHCDQPLCYRYDHLFLGTAKANAADMDAKGRSGGRFEAGLTPTKKLTPDDVVVIRQLLAQGQTMSHLARVYGVHRTTILGIRDGRIWRWLS